MQHLPCSESTERAFSPRSAAENEDDTSYYRILQALAAILENRKADNQDQNISKEVERLVWEASAGLSDCRPPTNFCVFNREGATQPPDDNPNLPPIFDGQVANATPPPLGGASTGPSGGCGTVLHLACAMDSPLLLAFLMCMGADGRASHTAFRRLMIHEAACNGSIHCLKLLLEMGKRFAGNPENSDRDTSIFMPDTFDVTPSSRTAVQPRLSRLPPVAMRMRQMERETFCEGTHNSFLTILHQFRDLFTSVKLGDIQEVEAARKLLHGAFLPGTTRTSLIRSCAFKANATSRSFLRPTGCADGHGNTPLHWAAFKNERACVSLLLDYDADPNARAHPSGWTPLHDAAYSNSSESVELLIDKGAHVDARANSGATPLCFAAQEDASLAARLLLDRGAALTARCAGTPIDQGQQVLAANHPHSRFSGYTPLHYCAHYNAFKAGKILLKHRDAKMAMETPDLSGRLPIHVAVARGSSDILRALLHAGARIDVNPTSALASTPASATTSLFAAVARTQRRPPSPEVPGTPVRGVAPSRSGSASPVTSPVLRSMIPQQPITSSKPWNCLTQVAIDECKDLISKAEQSWSPEHHLLFTPQDRMAVMELLRVGKRLEQNGTGIFLDLWPLVLGFCGRGWFEKEEMKPRAIEFCEKSVEESDGCHTDDEDAEMLDAELSLPTLQD